jgi:NTP pyrophosphatase (non-canonical NTP hydrolase)
MDSTATIDSLKDRVRVFCEARDWDQFHGPKDLAIGVATEASELLEHFRFMNDEEASSRLAEPERRLSIEEELADVLFFILRFAQRFDVDLDSALAHKIKKNDDRYPVAKARGSNLKHDEL